MVRATRPGADRRGSFRAAVLRNANQQRSKAANYGHLILPRGTSIFKEEAGTRAVSLDILPYIVTDPRHPDRDEEFRLAVEGEMWYRRPYKMHRQIGVGNITVICPTGAGQKCPVCEYRAKLLSDGANWKDKAISALRASDRNLYYVSIKGSNKYESEKEYLWDISQFAFQKLLNEELEQNEEFGDFPDLDVGLTLRIRFREERIETNSFIEASKIDFEARDYAYDKALIRGLGTLDSVPDLKDYKEIEQLFFETDVGGDEEDDEPVDSPPSRTMSRPREDARTSSAEPARPSMSRPRSEPDQEPARRVVSLQERDLEPGEGDEDEAPYDEVEEEQPAQSQQRRSAPRRESDPGLTIASDYGHERHRPPSQDVTAPAARTPTRGAASVVRSPGRSDTGRPTARRGANGGVDTCPKGHRFGVDVDQFEEDCGECLIWHDCYDAKEAARA